MVATLLMGDGVCAPGGASDATQPSPTCLDLSNAYWGDDKVSDVVEAVRRAAYPVQLDLRGNRFEASGAKALAEMLKAQRSVVALCLEWNNVGLLDEGVEALAAALEVDTRLLELDLRNNNVGPEGAKALAKALKRNRTLRKLDLRWNEIGNAGVLAFLEALQSNHALLALEITGNNSSFKHAEEIERLLVRNRSLQGQHPPEEVGKRGIEAATSPVKPSSNHSDQLLLQVLGEKETLETDLTVAKRHNAKLVEKIEECELQIQLLRKENDSAKQDRDRYQQRELDAKAEAHEARMRLEELENRRRVEFEEYRVSRASLERECNVMREKMNHFEALHQQSDDQKNKQIAQLEELKYKLESEVHRLTLATGSQQEEYAKLKKELLDMSKEHERREHATQASHKAEQAAMLRQNELAVATLQSQLTYTNEQLNDVKRSLTDLKDKHDATQATLLQERVTHEKQLHEMKKQWESESQDRIQRAMSAVEAQVEEIKKSRVFLEREVEKHLDTIVRLRQENVTLQQASDERLLNIQTEMDRQYKDLQEKQDQLHEAQKETAKANEAMQLLHRRLEEQERSTSRMKQVYEDRIRDQTSAAEQMSLHYKKALREKEEAIARLESDLLRAERLVSKQQHEHEQRFDGLAEAMTSFLQDQVKKEHERRTQRQQSRPRASSSAEEEAGGADRIGGPMVFG